MRLRIVTPLMVIVDEEFDSLRAEDASGGFGIQPGHAPFLTALAVSIVSWRFNKTERFCAVRGGVLHLQNRSVLDITTREAVVGDDLSTLDKEVLGRFRSDVDAEKIEHVEAVQLQLNVIRRMVSRLRPGVDTGEYR